MADESLRELLRRADAGPPVWVSGAADVTASVRRRRVAQRRLRVTASVVAAILVASLAAIMLPSREPERDLLTIVEPGETVRLQREVASLRADARVHALTADALALKHRARQVTARAQEDPLAEVRFQRDRAAMTLVYEAERFSRDAHQNERAITQFRKVIDLFPGSRWADVARQRLREIQS